ncbi:MAG: acetyl-CoA carboxylase biotin carboxyl carrier protein [Candidatus Limnocylindria bacterium]
MTDSSEGEALDVIRHAASDLIPQLRSRLARHGLGEIEVSRDGLRLRVVAAPGSTGARIVPASSIAPEGNAAQAAAARAEAVPDSHGVPSPAVGFFVYADGLGPGLGVEKGDGLGYVEMLGVRHDVLAPRSGTVRNLVAESGEAVEYGQVVLELEPVGSKR